jgi:ABC-type Mn2+/Zn2+ transport system ATPase subunit
VCTDVATTAPLAFRPRHALECRVFRLATPIVRGLSAAAGPRPLLADVDLTVAPGDRLGPVGPNGSGKSTLLQTLAGLRSPEDGRVRLAPPTATVGYLPPGALGPG